MKATQQKIIETKTTTFAEPRRSRFNKKTLLFAVIFLLLAGIAYYFFAKYQELKQNPDAINQEEAIALAAEVGEIMVLPQDEIPTIATVSNPELLADQAFFKDAKKGDKVLIYSQAGKAVLYDPEAKKIIGVAPISGGQTESL
ncbi:MAG: hypothetical protein KBD16_03970 [Candidatus Pacebacteria bacterium]|nr:hypothetical protein [Candidatus Paceibacterota bacterium]